jgi:hypothetical protein
MRLFEFDNNDPLRVKLTAVTSQLQSDLQNANSEDPMSTNAFLQLLNQNDIIIDKSDIYDIIKKEPLVHFIKDIEDDKVIFRGQVLAKQPTDPDESEQIVAQMAKKAAK